MTPTRRAVNRVLLSQADTTDVEERAVAAAMRSGWLPPLGPSVDAFEREMAERTGVGSALALSSGTAALHLGLLGVGVRPQSTVVVASLTFAASVNAITSPMQVPGPSPSTPCQPTATSTLTSSSGPWTRSGPRAGSSRP